ncbi:MAG: SGNH/GDSL hydrolase family protein [Clostridiales bacterium]
MKKKIFTLILCLVTISSMLFNVSAQSKSRKKEYKFDFGSVSVEKGFVGVNSTDKYTKEKGYGFNSPEYIKDVVAVGTEENNDAIRFLKFGVKSKNTFNVDLPNGLYEIELTLGNTTRSSVAAEEVYQVMNMTGNNCYDKFQIPITDGQLNILVTEGKAGAIFTLSSIKIKKISNIPITKKTIYLCGDSTTCNYYPLETTNQAGWGQMFFKYIKPEKYNIKNMATGGQIARGFKNDGQFESIMKYIKPGDVYMLDLGINDVNAKHNEPVGEFKEHMRDMIVQTKSKGALVILVTPHGRSIDFNENGIHYAEEKWYRNATIELSQEENVSLIDMNVLSSKYFTSIGPTATLDLFKDNVHFNRDGATKIAEIIAKDMKDKKLLGRSSYTNLLY